MCERPNVLFIAVDDLVTTLGCYGDAVAQTPRIDSLASQGTTFINHYCQWAVCGPSRASMSTSLMPEETGVMGFKPIRAILPDVITLPQHFKNQGYETAGTGKFYDPRTVGTIVDPNSPTLQDNEDLPSWSIPYVSDSGGYSPPGHPAVDQSATEPFANYTDFLIKEDGLSLIDTLAVGNKPFFLAVGFKKPHLPFVAPKQFWDLYDPNAMPLATYTSLPVNVTPTSDLATTINDNDELLGYTPYDTVGLPSVAQQRELLHGYYACVSMVDTLVGELLDKLAATPDPVQVGKTMAETTIVVLWGDHGFHLGDHGRWAKHSVMEQGAKCPLIIYDPRNPTTAATNHTTSPANSMDIYPTLCELAGLPVPSQPISDTVKTGRPIRGRSLVPVMLDPSLKVNGGAITHFSTSGRYAYAYRTERFRYIEWVNNSNNVLERELFDYETDPLETRNVADDPAYQAIVYQLARAMRAETGIRGTGRLTASAATTIGGDACVPFVSIAASGMTGVSLDWPGSGGVSYNIIASETLAPGSWGVDFASVQGPSLNFPMTGSRRFFRVGFGAGVPPMWLSDPVLKNPAYVGSGYSDSLAADVSDPGDTVTFIKLEGPSWLSVAADGSLIGTPAAGDALCASYATVEATDSTGLTARAKVVVNVLDPSTNQAPQFAADPVLKADAYVSSPYTDSLALDASDPDAGQTMTFSLVSSPTWLTVAADGTLSGTPTAGDVGTNDFTIRVEDNLGGYDEATLRIEVLAGAPPGIELVTQANESGNSITYGNVFFPSVAVQSGDWVVVAHANNKNTNTNTITLSGLGGNAISSISSGTSGTQSAAWVFYVPITTAGTYDLTLDTSNATKTVSYGTSLYVLRPTNGGTLGLAASAANVAGVSPGVLTLDLSFAMSPAIVNGFGVACSATNGSSIASLPADWLQNASGNSKRVTCSNANVNGASLDATFTNATAADLALAGIIVKASP